MEKHLKNLVKKHLLEQPTDSYYDDEDFVSSMPRGSQGEKKIRPKRQAGTKALQTVQKALKEDDQVEMSPVMRKPVFRVCDPVRLKLASATEISYRLEIFSSTEPSGSQGELIVYPYSGVRRRQQFLNIFSSETALPIKAKFYVEPSWEGGTKVYINGPGHMTKMAAMPIYGENL